MDIGFGLPPPPFFRGTKLVCWDEIHSLGDDHIPLAAKRSYPLLPLSIKDSKVTSGKCLGLEM